MNEDCQLKLKSNFRIVKTIFEDIWCIHGMPLSFSLSSLFSKFVAPCDFMSYLLHLYVSTKTFRSLSSNPVSRSTKYIFVIYGIMYNAAMIILTTISFPSVWRNDHPRLIFSSNNTGIKVGRSFFEWWISLPSFYKYHHVYNTFQNIHTSLQAVNCNFDLLFMSQNC